MRRGKRSSSAVTKHDTELYKDMARFQWRLTTLMWQLLCAALLPIRVGEISEALQRFIQYLKAYGDKSYERQIAVFTRSIQEYSG